MVHAAARTGPGRPHGQPVDKAGRPPGRPTETWPLSIGAGRLTDAFLLTFLNSDSFSDLGSNSIRVS